MNNISLKEPTPVLQKSVNIETTQNQIYVADNFDVMRWLARSGKGFVQSIVIDPPYGRRHSDTGFVDNYGDPALWMDFLRPRLALSRELLTHDGVIMVSMDDSRIHWLRILLDEVFGERNYINTIIWYSAAMSRYKPHHLRNAHEYILVYGRDLREVTINSVRQEKLRFRNVVSTIRRLAKHFDFTLDDGLSALGIYKDVETGELYELYNSVTGKKDFFKSPLDDIWYIPPINRMAAEYIPGFIGQKPVALIKQLLRVFGKPGSVVLDYFAGTGTTGQAVMELNQEDGGKRSFILVQKAEECREDTLLKRGYERISDIMLDRMHRVSSKNADLGFDNGFQVLEF